MNPHSRPVFLNLLRIRLPLNALVSIAHRISGVLLALSIPLLITALDLSLRDAAGFAAVRAGLQDSIALRLFMVLVYWASAHHVLCGIRYLLIDLDIGVSRDWSRRSAAAVLGGGLVFLLLALGVWL